MHSSAISSQRATSEVHRLKNVAAEAQEIRAAAVAWPVHLYWNEAFHAMKRTAQLYLIIVSIVGAPGESTSSAGSFCSNARRLTADQCHQLVVGQFGEV